MSDVLFVHGIDRNASADEIRRAARQVFEQAANGCPWLRPGDKVLLKVSLNSPDPYPVVCRDSIASTAAPIRAHLTRPLGSRS